ncbi:MAG: dienelactone hydrolase family protein [Anaerolineae bacterium]|nr:dienelactone hydrolase family protein [Anaerolineae bacterium]
MSTTQPDGFLALPAAGGGKPVLVLHAWWGLNDTIKAFSQRLADSGFAVFAPDLYHGKVTDQIEEAGKLGATLDNNIDRARADVAAGLAYLKERAGSSDTGVAVIGFSLGAFYALDLSASEPDSIRSVVLFYGTGPVDVNKVKADYLGHFAQNDPYEAPENVDELENALKRVGRAVTFYRYAGTGHWFFEPDRTQAYDPAAASLAWERTLAFLRRTANA